MALTFCCCRLTEVVGIRQNLPVIPLHWEITKEWMKGESLFRMAAFGWSCRLEALWGGIKETSSCNTNETTCRNRVDLHSVCSSATTRNFLFLHQFRNHIFHKPIAFHSPSNWIIVIIFWEKQMVSRTPTVWHLSS